MRVCSFGKVIVNLLGFPEIEILLWQSSYDPIPRWIYYERVVVACYFGSACWAVKRFKRK